MNLGNLVNKGLQGWSKGVDDLLSNPTARGLISAGAMATGIPGMDAVLLGVEKLIPEGGINLFGKPKSSTTTPPKSQGNTPIKPVVPSGQKVGGDAFATKQLTQGQKTSLINNLKSTMEETTPAFDVKSWSTYPNWLKWTIYIVAPMGLIFAVWSMMKKNSTFKRF